MWLDSFIIQEMERSKSQQRGECFLKWDATMSHPGSFVQFSSQLCLTLGFRGIQAELTLILLFWISFLDVSNQPWTTSSNLITLSHSGGVGIDNLTGITNQSTSQIKTHLLHTCCSWGLRLFSSPGWQSGGISCSLWSCSSVTSPLGSMLWSSCPGK